MMSAILLIIGFVLLIFWFLGFIGSYTLGGFIYIALSAGIILLAGSLMHRLVRRSP
jgi:hypothetical protein